MVGELSLACHIRVATKRVSQPEINWFNSRLRGNTGLTQIVGKSKALEMMLTTDMISAEDALSIILLIM